MLRVHGDLTAAMARFPPLPKRLPAGREAFTASEFRRPSPTPSPALDLSMASHYSIKSFFRNMPSALLARYFHRRGALTDFKFSELRGIQRDTLFEAWHGLDSKTREEIESDFQEIYALSRDAGARAIIDEAEWQMRQIPGAHTDFVKMFSALPNHYERAMVAFLDYPACWRGATLLHHADLLPHWRKRAGFPKKPAAVDSESINQLSRLIREFFHRTEGRGNHCFIDCLRRGDRDYFFAYPEDFSRKSNEWSGGLFKPRPHNPAFEIVFIYSETAGKLDMNFRGDHRRVRFLQEMFATAILKLEKLPDAPQNERIYDLSKLVERGFEFAFDAASGIEDVRLKLLRLSSVIEQGNRITVEADPENDFEAVHNLLAKIGISMPLHNYKVTRAELTASVKAGIQSKKVSFSLTHPYYCSLKYEGVDLILRAMLEKSGIEPSTEPEG